METFRQILVEHLGGEPLPRGAIAGMSRRTAVRDHVISRWVNKKHPRRPSPENLERIAPDLGVPYDQLVQIVYAGASPQTQPDDSDRASYHQRLAQVAEALSAAANEIRALAALDRNGEMPSQSAVEYIYQERRSWRRLWAVPSGGGPPAITRVGGGLRLCTA